MIIQVSLDGFTHLLDSTMSDIDSDIRKKTSFLNKNFEGSTAELVFFLDVASYSGGKFMCINTCEFLLFDIDKLMFISGCLLWVSAAEDIPT